MIKSKAIKSKWLFYPLYLRDNYTLQNASNIELIGGFSYFEEAVTFFSASFESYVTTNFPDFKSLSYKNETERWEVYVGRPVEIDEPHETLLQRIRANE